MDKLIPQSSAASTTSIRSGKDFKFAVSKLPAKIERVHRGRDIDTGLDCAGLFLWIYRVAGKNVDHIDCEYSENDFASPTRVAFMTDRLLRGGFRNVAGQVSRGWFKDGDVLILGVGGAVHLGIYVDGMIYQMGKELKIMVADRLRPWIVDAFRLKPGE